MTVSVTDWDGNPPMMGCGHAANATSDGEPSCVICAGIDPRATVVANAPSLAGRSARCSCGATRPSSTSLAFFEFRGEGSRTAREACAHCGYAQVAHTYGGNFAPPSPSKNRNLCINFDPPRVFEPRGGQEFDVFYCGHAGWD